MDEETLLVLLSELRAGRVDPRPGESSVFVLRCAGCERHRFGFLRSLDYLRERAEEADYVV